jgi:hypothetical protein
VTPFETLRNLAAATLLALVAIACTAQGFNERLAGGYSTVAYSRDAAGVLLDAGKMTAAEAANLQAQADHLRGALDITREISAYDLSTAEAKLAATLAALDELREYLRAQGAPADTGGQP